MISEQALWYCIESQLKSGRLTLCCMRKIYACKRRLLLIFFYSAFRKSREKCFVEVKSLLHKIQNVHYSGQHEHQLRLVKVASLFSRRDFLPEQIYAWTPNVRRSTKGVARNVHMTNWKNLREVWTPPLGTPLRGTHYSSLWKRKKLSLFESMHKNNSQFPQKYVVLRLQLLILHLWAVDACWRGKWLILSLGTSAETELALARGLGFTNITNITNLIIIITNY